MGLLDGFEKLINEHGSAVILKERITLANEKYATLEQKLTESELRANDFESKNQGLSLDLKKTQEKIRNLEEELVERHGQRLEEVKEQLLQLLAKRPNVTDAQIAEALHINVQLATFHLTEMENSRLVHADYSTYEDTEWSIAHEGRGYLVRHELLA